MQNAILLTGTPGCGKTTLIRKVLSLYQGQSGGFYTQEIRSGRIREGFKLITLKGDKGVLAHVNISSEMRVGKYGVDIDVLDQLGVGSIYNALNKNQLVVIDEIGPMEIKSSKFRKAVWDVILSKSQILGSIMLRSNSFADQIKARPEVQLFTINSENRDALSAIILKLIEKNKGEHPGFLV